jgi:stage V sporulation protein D (sporulation-specific penicillin-binding protein)
MRKDKGNYRNKLNKKELIKWKKRKKEENINVKKEQKQAQKDIKRKYKKEIKNKKVKPEEKISNMSRKKRMKNEIIIVWLALITLLARIGWIQFGMGSELQSKAYVQQTLDRSINPRRGTIYDSTGTNILAVSSTVETVTVNPVNIKKEDKEKVAKALSNIFELDYEKVYKKVNKRSSIETIIKKIDKEKSNELRVWLQENNITAGVNIDEDTKRYYPYNNLASQIIGFSGSDNQGLDGIEAVYDEQLKGTKGKIQKITDATGGEIEKESENYVKAIDGNDLILTIDATIQGIAEKYLKEACIENKCTDGGNIVVMNPKTGDVLAIAGYPNYNLNEPFEPSTEELKQQWPNMSQAERNKTMLSLWRNKAVTDTYEPGSVFKLITASASLQEGITTTDKAGEFCCTGGIEIAGVRIKCWRYYRPHGPESLRDALMNSCNPVFIGLGQKLGVNTYYKYLRKFGLLNQTGIDLPGEATSIFLKEEKVGPVELATIAFGQRFEITPIQLATAVSTIANGGVKVTPRVVKQIVNSETGEITDIPIKTGEQVISKEHANEVLDMMESVVALGTGKRGQVAGYRVGGKTGTSEDGVNTNKYVASFLGVAPISDPTVVALVTLYDPKGEAGHQGGVVAAPVGGQVLSEILPYLELTKDNEKEEDIKKQVEVPNVEGLSIKEATKILKNVNLNLQIENSPEDLDTENTIIKEQVPKKGITVYESTKIIIKI